jgi:hypothetical protein
VLVSAAALRAMPVQYVLSLLESFTFGDVHVRSVEHLAGVEQHGFVSAAALHAMPAQYARPCWSLSPSEACMYGASSIRQQHAFVSAAALHSRPV